MKMRIFSLCQSFPTPGVVDAPGAKLVSEQNMAVCYSFPMELEKLKKECDIKAFKSSGPGGQHRNVTESAVRLKHLPTGIIVIGQSHRSQHRNLLDALERLARKLEDRAKRRKPRVPTRKAAGIRAREVEAKRKNSRLKRSRGKIGHNMPED